MLTHTQYKRKIALQAKHFFVPAPRMRCGFYRAQEREMAAYKRVSRKWNTINCQCDRARRLHLEAHGEGYPYFECRCGRDALHAVLVKHVARVNARQLKLGMAQNEGVLAHIKRGDQAWAAKKKWKEQNDHTNHQRQP